MELVSIKSNKRDGVYPSPFLRTKKGEGFTLVEIIVTVFVFSLTVGTAMGIFASVIKLQRYNLKQQELLNQTGYVMEYMSRAIRMAQKNDGTICSGWTNKNYNWTATSIEFATYHNPSQCWKFFLDGTILKINKNGTEEYPLISNNFAASSPQLFTVSGDGAGSQPKVLILMTVQGAGLGDQPQITIQTTISQRNLNE